MTGGGTAASLLGFPDLGLLTMSEMAAAAGRMARAVSVPVIADADTGYGNELNVFRTVQEYEREGVAAIQIEDQVFPKRCGHLDGKDVVAREDFVAKVRAAAAARRLGALIVARTDAAAVAGFEEAVARMNAALDAGADIAFLEGPRTMEELAEAPRRIAGPCLLNLPPRGARGPRVEPVEVAAMGYRVVILPGLLSRHVVVACEEVLTELRDGGVYPLSAKEPASMAAHARRFGLDEWERRGTQFR
jgi:2-methylisocitrate lyase-like PEP mutase family enzyme